MWTMQRFCHSQVRVLPSFLLLLFSLSTLHLIHHRICHIIFRKIHAKIAKTKISHVLAVSGSTFKLHAETFCCRCFIFKFHDSLWFWFLINFAAVTRNVRHSHIHIYMPCGAHTIDEMKYTHTHNEQSIKKNLYIKWKKTRIVKTMPK